MYRVYDDRTNETLYKNEDIMKCVDFLNTHFTEGSSDWDHVWVE